MILDRFEEFEPNGSQDCSIHTNETPCSEQGSHHVMMKREPNGDAGCVIACEGHFLLIQKDSLMSHALTSACVSSGSMWSLAGCSA